MFGQGQVSAAQSSCELLAATVHSSWLTDALGEKDIYEGINSIEYNRYPDPFSSADFFFYFFSFYPGIPYSLSFSIANTFFLAPQQLGRGWELRMGLGEKNPPQNIHTQYLQHQSYTTHLTAAPVVYPIQPLYWGHLALTSRPLRQSLFKIPLNLLLTKECPVSP